MQRRLSSTLSSPLFASSLERVATLVQSSLHSLHNLRKSNVAWTSALSALESIAKSPRKSLFRPQLVFLGCLSSLEQNKMDWQGFPQKSFIEYFAAGVELQHLYMIVHDDVMDHGTIRRGLPTVQIVLSKTGFVRSSQVGREIADHLAILVGDCTNAISLKLMLQGITGLGRPDALNVILESALHAGAAQFDDVVGWEGVERRLQSGEYLNDIQSLHAIDISAEHGFSAPLIAGLRLGPKIWSTEREQKQYEEELRRFGTLLGISFYDLADVTDIVCDSSETGKDSLQDLREGRLSQPLFSLRKYANVEEWEDVSQILRGFNTQGNFFGPMTLFDRRRILSLMSKYRILGRTIEASEAKLSEAESLVKKWEETTPQFAAGCQKFIDGLRLEGKTLMQKADSRFE